MSDVIGLRLTQKPVTSAMPAVLFELVVVVNCEVVLRRDLHLFGSSWQQLTQSKASNDLLLSVADHLLASAQDLPLVDVPSENLTDDE